MYQPKLHILFDILISPSHLFVNEKFHMTLLFQSQGKKTDGGQTGNIFKEIRRINGANITFCSEMLIGQEMKQKYIFISYPQTKIVSIVLSMVNKYCTNHYYILFK